MKNESTIRVRVSSDLLSAVDYFAASATHGNRSEAIRQMLEAGLNRCYVVEECRKAIDGTLEEHLERMRKITSRGTKASLANLIMTSTYLPPLTEMSRETGDMVIDGFRRQGVAVSDGSFDVACAGAEKLRLVTSGEAMDYCWNAGGRIQQAGSRPTYYAATKGLRFKKKPAVSWNTEEPKQDFGSWFS